MINGSEMANVSAVAAYLKDNPGVFLRVEGNCDERGTEEYNRSLGERRALAVPRGHCGGRRGRQPGHHGQLWQGSAGGNRQRRGGLEAEPPGRIRGVDAEVIGFPSIGPGSFGALLRALPGLSFFIVGIDL